MINVLFIVLFCVTGCQDNCNNYEYKDSEIINIVKRNVIYSINTKSFAHSRAFNSNEYVNQKIISSKLERVGWIIRRPNDVRPRIYFVEFRYEDDDVFGLVRADVDLCGRVVETDQGAWLKRPVNSKAGEKR